MKKLISVILCLMLVFGLASPAFAAETTYTLIIDSTTPGHTFEAWQIFSGTLETITASDNSTKEVLTNIEWGSAIKGEGYDNSAALLNEIKTAATAQGAPASIIALSNAIAASKAKNEEFTAAMLADAIADNFQTNLTSNPDLEQLSRIMEAHFGNGKAAATDNYDDGKYEMTGLSAGYYLIKDKDGSLAGENDSYTKFMLRVLKDEKVTPKADAPEVKKTINDTLGGTFTEHEDFDINDYAYYKWEGTLPSNLLSYETYYYAFHDTLKHAGLTFVRIEQIYLEGHDGNVVHTFYDVSNTEKTITEEGEHSLVDGIKLKVDKEDNGHTKIDLIIDNMFDLYGKDKILPTQYVIVKYTARINRDAVIAESMDNAVNLEFSNDPNFRDDGTTPTGKTPDDVARAFTFDLSVNKTDGDTKKVLEGAEFILYYKRTENEAVVSYYAQVVTEEMVYVADSDGKLTNELKPEADRMINNIPVDGDDIGVVYGWTTDKTQASILDTDANGKFHIRGLDEDIYFLEETKSPTGYNLLKEPIQFEIDPVYNEDGTLMEVNYKLGTQTVSSTEIPVENFTGSTLPSTGGTGTTLFYVFGGIMVLAAVVLLVTKKRMAG